jgi:TMEM175 potassium channel family protein
MTRDDAQPPEGTAREAGLAAQAGRQPRARMQLSLLSELGNLEYDRVLFFSDAVIAIAITLLVVDIRVPDLPASLIHAGDVLRTSGSRIFGFALSFAVIGMFWMGHHSVFRHIRALDRTLISLNLLFLATVAFLPFPTALLSAASTQQAPATIFYAACVAAAGLAELAIWLYAIKTAGLVADSVTPLMRRYYAVRMARTPLVFGLSIPVAAVAPGVAPYLWILTAVAGVVIRRVMLRHGTDDPDT